MESGSSSMTSSSTNYENEQLDREAETMKPLIEDIKEKNAQVLERIVQQITEKDAKIAEKDQRIAEMEKESAAKEQKIEELKQALIDAQKTLTNSVGINSHLIETHKAESTKLQSEISERDKIILDLKEGTKNSKEEHEKEKAELQAEIIQLKNSDADKQKAIDQLAERNRKLKSESQEKENLIAELKEANSKLVDPRDIITVRKLQSKAQLSMCKTKTFMTSFLSYDGKKWIGENHEDFLFDHSDCKIYVHDFLTIISLPPAKFSTLIERLHSNCLFGMDLENLSMSFADYKELVAKSNDFMTFVRITVRNEDGTLIGVDQLMKEVPNVKLFRYQFNNGEKMDEIAQKLARLPALQNRAQIYLCNIQEGFDLEAFGQFFKTNSIEGVYCSLQFNVSKETFAKIERIKAEIVSSLPSSSELEIFGI